MPLMPVTRPLNSANSATATPMIAPPVSADQGVNVVQSMLTVRPRVPKARAARAVQTIRSPIARRYRSCPVPARHARVLRDAGSARAARVFPPQIEMEFEKKRGQYRAPCSIAQASGSVRVHRARNDRLRMRLRFRRRNRSDAVTRRDVTDQVVDEPGVDRRSKSGGRV